MLLPYNTNFLFFFPGRAILKRWTNIRDAYLKSLRKEQYSQTPIKPYTYSENLKFLKNTFKLPSAEDSTSNSSLTNEHFNFVEVPAKNLSESDESDRENNSANTEITSSPARKKVKTEVESPTILGDIGDRHISFFKGILPSLQTLTEDEIVEFQMGVLELMINIKRNRLQC